jgi:hypothetical protein
MILAAAGGSLLAACGGTSTTNTQHATSTQPPDVPTTKSSGGSARGLLYGMNSNSAAGHSATWVAANVLGDRSNHLDVGYSDSPEEVSAAVSTSLADGCVPLVIINSPDGTVLSDIDPGAYASGAMAIIARVVADHPTVRTFELINEPYFKGPHKMSNASDYANIVARTYEQAAAVHLQDVKLLVAAWGRFEVVDHSGEGTGKISDPQEGGGWIHDMAVQQPVLKKVVNGWASHPYGAPEGPSTHHDFGLTSTEDQRNDAGIVGFNLTGRNDWWITEVGFELGRSGAGGASTEDEQAADIAKVLTRSLTWHEEGWLRGVFIYDDGSSGYNIYGRRAQATLTSFASQHR